MDYRNIGDYIKTLSQEERELHKDLIKECSERESDLCKISEENKLLINNFKKSKEEYYKGLIEINNNVLAA